jgi:hypothetical protein
MTTIIIFPYNGISKPFILRLSNILRNKRDENTTVHYAIQLGHSPSEG